MAFIGIIVHPRNKTQYKNVSHKITGRAQLLQRKLRKMSDTGCSSRLVRSEQIDEVLVEYLVMKLFSVVLFANATVIIKLLIMPFL